MDRTSYEEKPLQSGETGAALTKDPAEEIETEFTCEPTCNLACCAYICEYCTFSITDSRVKPCHVAIEKPDLKQIRIRLQLNGVVTKQRTTSSVDEASGR